jgi:hypothetical protein
VEHVLERLSFAKSCIDMGCVGAVIFLLVAAGACYWACEADKESEQTCVEHGERYIDGRAGHTLCEQDGGTVVRR